MKRVLLAVILACSFALSANADEPPAEKLVLKDGTTLFLHPDGTSRHVDQHGKAMAMADGVEMETADGQMIMMMNNSVWVKHGPPGKGGRHLKTD